jgi:hypothetical protein
MAKINQFIRPNTLLTCIDTASATKRLALKGTRFASSDKVAVAIGKGVVTDLANAVMVMASLGSCFESLSNEVIHILADLYTAALSAATKTADAVIEPEGPNMTHHACL